MSGHGTACSEPTEWSEEAAQLLDNSSTSNPKLRGNSSLRDVIVQLPHAGGNVPEFLAVFQEAVQKAVNCDCAGCFVELCNNRRQCFDHGAGWKDFEFSYNYAASERPHFLVIICEARLLRGLCYEYEVGELGLLTDLALRANNWSVPSSVFTTPKDMGGDMFLSSVQRKVEECVVSVILHETSWPVIACIVDRWLSNTGGRGVKELVESVEGRFERESWSASVVSRAKQCCVDNSPANLAFVLGLVFKDWDLVETVITSMSSLVGVHLLMTAVEMAARPQEQGGSLDAVTAFLAAIPIETLIHIMTYYGLLRSVDLTRLTTACEKRGRWNLALVIQRYNVTYLLNCYKFAENRSVLDWILCKTVIKPVMDGKEVELVFSLLKDCTDLKTLQDVLYQSVCIGQRDIVEALLNQVDPSEGCVDHESETLLFHDTIGSLYLDKEQKLEMVRSLLNAGLSPFQSDVNDTTNLLCLEQDPRAADFNTFILKGDCLLMHAFMEKLPDVVDCTLDFGSYSHKTLKAFAHDARTQRMVENLEDLNTCHKRIKELEFPIIRQELQDRLRRAEENEKLKKCFARIQEAAVTPTSLEQLARLAVSRRVGCHPGRKERVDKLPLPVPLKNIVKHC